MMVSQSVQSTSEMVQNKFVASPVASREAEMQDCCDARIARVLDAVAVTASTVRAMASSFVESPPTSEKIAENMLVLSAAGGEEARVQ